MPVTLPGKETVIDGVRMYVSEAGRQYIADKWDAMYLPAHSFVLNKNNENKHDNPNRQRAWLKGKKSY
jgi:hypothetical protein